MSGRRSEDWCVTVTRLGSQQASMGQGAPLLRVAGNVRVDLDRDGADPRTKGLGGDWDRRLGTTT